MTVSLYSDVATKENAPDPTDQLDAQRANAKEYVTQFVVELVAAAQNSEVALCRLRKGDEILPGSNIKFDNLGAGTSIDIGDNDDTDAVDADRYLDGQATTAAGEKYFPAVDAIDKTPYTVQKDCWLIMTILGGAATGTVKGTIKRVRAGG